MGLDNLSSIPEWFLDTLCRAVTGEGDVRCTLHSQPRGRESGYRYLEHWRHKYGSA